VVRKFVTLPVNGSQFCHTTKIINSSIIINTLNSRAGCSESRSLVVVQMDHGLRGTKRRFSIPENSMPQLEQLTHVDPRHQSIQAAFSSRAAQHPKRIALLFEDQEITYGELAARSDAIARELVAAGLRPGQIVGLYLHRSAEAVAAILGVLKAGGAYLPFDPSFPPKMLRHIYEASAPALMVSESQLADTDTGSRFWDGGTILVDRSSSGGEGRDAFAAPTAPDDLAYVMYTSGSTGRPKGVMVPHRAVLRLVIDNDFARLDSDEVLLQLAPLSFDASTFEIWGALLNGGRLAILPTPHPSLDQIATAIVRHGITTLWLTAGLFHLMVDHCLQGLAPLRQLLAGGDVLSPRHVEKALQALPDCRLINGYGPTENTTFTCCHSISPQDCRPGPIPIGRPIAQTEAYVLDEMLQPVADGLDGELYVGGTGVALGYLNQPELTAERFISNPFHVRSGARLYRTGDRVRRRPDGILEFLGRADRQVKINGKRVELDDIEACLRRSTLIADAAVITTELPGGQRRIAAYVTPAAGKSDVVAPLRAFLREELPEYMRPATITVLDALPLSPTGKVDRNRLPLPSVVIAKQAEAAKPPRTGVEATLIGIWRRVLGVETIGVEDNFFDLGGTSLQLLEVHAAVRASLKQDITVVDLFRYPRISALTNWIESGPSMQRGLFTAQDRARRQSAASKYAQQRQHEGLQ
jgi:amino acid adenylation domain-containing protein